MTEICTHPGIVRRLGDYPAYWKCSDCDQHFRDLGGNLRDHPVDPPTVEKDGDPCPAI
jgi:hypothetical protein